jgi:predicted lipid carrier protein YhbT
MVDPVADFFERVVPERARLLPRWLKASARYDLERGDSTCDHWLVAFDGGTVRVSSDERPADATIRTDKELFDRVVTGEMDIGAAVFRNAVRVEGDVVLMGFFRRLFPGPPGARDPREFFREWRERQR